MEVVLCPRSNIPTSVTVVAGKFLTILSSTNLYIFDATSEEVKVCVKLKENCHNYDLLYTSSGVYVCYASDSGSLYAFTAPFFSKESHNLEKGWNLIMPDFHENIWKSSCTFELVAIDSENDTVFLLESLAGNDKTFTCYAIQFEDNNFSFNLLWMCNCNLSELIHYGDKTSLTCAVKMYFFISQSTVEKFSSVNSTISRNDKLIKMSNSLFVNLFGGRNNLECQLIAVMSFPDGILQWFPGSNAAFSDPLVSILWNMQEEIINVHSALVKSPSRKGEAEERDCLIIVGKSGSLVILGIKQYPCNVQFQVYCQINASDIFDDNLFFSTSTGIYAVCISDVLKDAATTTRPRLISRLKINSFRICPEMGSKGNIKIFACLHDNRVVKLSLSLNQGTDNRRKKIKQMMADIESITKQNIEVQDYCDSRSDDFRTLCVSSCLFRENKSPPHVVETIFPKLDLSIKEEYQCVSVVERLYSISVNLQLGYERWKDGDRQSYSCVVRVEPTLDNILCAKSFSKSSKLERLKLPNGVENGATLVCSNTQMLNLSLAMLPLKVAIFLLVKFDPVTNLSPLLVPLKTLEAGVLKFASLNSQLHLNECAISTDAIDIIRMKHPRNCLQSEVDALPLLPGPTWNSIQISLKQLPNDLWRIIFNGNSHLQSTDQTVHSLELFFMQNAFVRLEPSSGSASLLTVSSTSIQVLAMVHREILLILHKADCLSVPEKSLFPALQVIDVEQPPEKFMKTGSDKEPCLDSLQRLIQCYKLQRGTN